MCKILQKQKHAYLFIYFVVSKIKFYVVLTRVETFCNTIFLNLPSAIISIGSLTTRPTKHGAVIQSIVVDTYIFPHFCMSNQDRFDELEQGEVELYAELVSGIKFWRVYVRFVSYTTEVVPFIKWSAITCRRFYEWRSEVT